MNRLQHISFVLVFLCFGALASAQGTKSDYERADKLGGLVQGKVFKAKVTPHWLEGNSRFWYRNDLAEGKREFVLVDAEKGTRETAFDHAKLAMALKEKLGKDIVADKLPLEGIQIEADGAIRFNMEGKGWKFESASGALAEAEQIKLPEPRRPGEGRGPRGAGGPRGRREGFSQRRDESPDGKKTAFVRANNVFLKIKDGGEETQLTTDGKPEDSYDGGVFWAPDSSRFVALKTQRAEEHKVYLIESSPRDQTQPKLHTMDYQKPGDRIAVTKPHLFDANARKELPVSDTLFPSPWSVEEFRWSADSKRFTFLYNQRGHQVLRIVTVSGETGEAGTLVNEESKTFVDYAHKRFTHYADGAGELVWMSERDGWNHLYLMDSRTGDMKNQITKGPWIVRGVDRVDDDKRQIWFRAGGIYPEQDPYYIHHCRVNFDGSNPVMLTSGNGTHEIEYSPDGRYLLDSYSRVDQPPISELRKVEDGSLVCKLEEADGSKLLETGWKTPERFVAKGRDGTTDIYGVIYRPTNFDPAKKYPVIEAIYAGPQGSFVPKRFSSFHQAQAMSELGFVVVQIDGMGTSNRSKAFHDVCWKNLGDSGFPDRILWMKAAAAKYPQLDITRVGVYGGSAGGQSATRAVLAFGDFYKAAVSDCGCHDNRMDKMWWNELWMGHPIGPHYAEQSNVTQAKNLTGKLMLIVGELDRNVDPASTMQVADALIRANKDFDLIVIPGAGHGAGGGPYGQRRMRDFFVRSLLGVEPRRE
jgi:dipeptidyl aminopeptidase/acylaminoacyl peptidase